MEDSQQLEDNFTSFVWNRTPSSKIQQAKASIPPAVHVTPLDDTVKIPEFQYSPLVCGTCEALMNCFCPINFMNKTITCCICGVTVSLPASYSKNIRPEKLPFELMEDYPSFQYKTSLGSKATSRDCYLFVIDLCTSEQQLKCIKNSLIQVLEKLPENINVGLITFHKHIYVYELALRITTMYSINGGAVYDLPQVMNILGIDIKNQPQMKSHAVASRFIVPLEKHRETIIRRVGNLKPTPYIYVNERPQRALGQAVNTAIALAEACPLSVRVCLLIGGPGTFGPGAVISTNFKEQMRSIKQMVNGQNTEHYGKAKKYYDDMQKRVLDKKIIIDVFGFILEEFGLTEMGELVINSGGLVAMHEEFKGHIFKGSFPKLFCVSEDPETQVNWVSEAVVSVYASKEVEINGALGQCHSLMKKKPFVSSKVIGKGNTHSWYLGSLDKDKTITICYELALPEAKQQHYFMQFKTQYRNRQGHTVVRVTTVRREWSSRVHEIADQFDNEAAIVLLAKLCVNKVLFEEQSSIRKWLDTTICRWSKYFSSYITNEETSYKLPESMRRLPQLVYHLRRSVFITRFGCSLDQSFYHGLNILRQSVPNCVTMIQPVLLKYSLDDLEPVTIKLDQQEMKQDVILLLDSYFVVLEWYGPHVESWYENKYHEEEEYAHIKELIDAPSQDINYAMNHRFPMPNYYKVWTNHSKERYLKSRVNPRKTVENENMITDDSDMTAFIQHLIRATVKST